MTQLQTTPTGGKMPFDSQEEFQQVKKGRFLSGMNAEVSAQGV